MSFNRTTLSGTYRDLRVLVTGHTGFKGSWLALWLKHLGAVVRGVSLPPNTSPNHFDLLSLDIDSHFQDIRDAEGLHRLVREFKPTLVFHLAAQPLVRDSYSDPVGTYSTNVMGTLNLLEACRQTPSVRGILCITSDKVYENREWVWSYREHDALGGYDPYSSSKACCEVLISSYRNSFFPLSKFGKGHEVLLASARAGNVIGGGDWARDRLVPDAARAAAAGQPIVLRNPKAHRPWQYVLESLSGYLLLGERLVLGERRFAEAWNFGPADAEVVSVHSVIEAFQSAWPKLAVTIDQDPNAVHEAVRLQLDSAKAIAYLQWKPIWDWKTSVRKSAEWYQAYYEHNKITSRETLHDYLEGAKKMGLPWSGA